MSGSIVRIAAVLCMVLAPFALAHNGRHDVSGMAAGLVHPFTGWDHVLAMVAVGLWATQLGGKAKRIVPLVFVGAMAIGGMMAAAEMTLQLAEQGVLVSVLVFGLLVGASLRLPLAAAATVAAVFALLHGYAHVEELPPRESVLAFSCGFMVSTGILLATGLGMGNLLQRVKWPMMVRVCGGVVAMGAIGLWMGVI